MKISLGPGHPSLEGASLESDLPEPPPPAVTLADVVAALDRLSAATLAAGLLKPFDTSQAIADAFDKALGVVQDY